MARRLCKEDKGTNAKSDLLFSVNENTLEVPVASKANEPRARDDALEEFAFEKEMRFDTGDDNVICELDDAEATDSAGAVTIDVASIVVTDAEPAEGHCMHQRSSTETNTKQFENLERLALLRVFPSE